MIWKGELDVDDAAALVESAKRQGKRLAVIANVGEGLAQLNLVIIEGGWPSVISKNEERIN
jgi:hypothetical protein